MFTDIEEINMFAFSQQTSQCIKLGIRNKVHAMRSINNIYSCIISDLQDLQEMRTQAHCWGILI
jgi:hypothetical protein